MVEYLNIYLIEKSLNLERFDLPEKIEWLEKSHETGSNFWPSLCKYHDSLFGNAGKSRPFKQYDFFHDLITRNSNRETPAFIWYDSVNLWQEISYQTLGLKAERISDHWRDLGVLPGDTLCIIKQFGLGYLESLLAGLRTGVVISFIMPEGKAVIKKQLESLQPNYICTQNIYLPLLSGWQDKIIEEKGVEGTEKRDRGEQAHTDMATPSHTYGTGEVIARSFDPMCEDMFTPKVVFSDLFYLSGIRDGLVGLGLSPGDIVSAPGFNPVLTQPSLVLSVLINGASFLHLSMEDIKKNPDLLTRYPLKVLGVISRLRDILMAHPVRRVRIWKSWFRDPSEASDMHVWELFIKKLELEDIPAGCMVWNSAMGGCLLFSRKRKGQALQNVLPLPGRKWQLAMVGDDKTPALGGLGLFCVNAFLDSKEESYLATPCILAKTYLEKMFVGLNRPGRKGVYYPKELVTKIVRKIDGCRDAVVVKIPGIGNDSAPVFHLLIFTGNLQTMDPADVIKKVHRTIKSELGNAFFVDDISIFPLFPRRTQENKVDEDWCRAQYLNGGLKNKSKDDLFLGLSGLRAKALSGD